MTHLAEMFVQLQAKIIRLELRGDYSLGVYIMFCCHMGRVKSNRIGDEGVKLLSKALTEKESSLKYLQ